MRKLLLLSIITGWLVSCQCNHESNTSFNQPGADTATTAVATNTGALALNGTAKWKADSLTGNNVNHLRAIIEGFTVAGNGSLKSYKRVAGDLQTGLNKMVKECKMKGADHDALHHWLLPLLAQVKQLEQANATTTADTAFAAISHQVVLYYQYFE